MYFGETAINLDAKGRFAIPMRYRELLQEQCAGQLVLTYSAFDSGALWLSPVAHWEGMRGLQRRVVGSATPVEPDGSGRIQLPLTLRQVAGLEKHIVLLGMGAKFEIWNENILNSKRMEEERSLAETASESMRNLVL